VFESKRNKFSSVSALFHYILKNEKHIRMPKDESGGTLRGLLRSISAAISAEFCTVALVNSQLVLCAEAEMSSNGKAFLDQFHRGISCPIEQFEEFENACAQGMLFSKMDIQSPSLCPLVETAI